MRVSELITCLQACPDQGMVVVMTAPSEIGGSTQVYEISGLAVREVFGETYGSHVVFEDWVPPGKQATRVLELL